MCNKKNSVLFNDTECIILSLNFKLTDESHVLLKVPRKNNMYSVDLKNIVLKGGLTCLLAKSTSNESKLWNRRLGHINFKTMNKLVKGNLVRGLPLKLFENEQTCVACQKGKQHKASCKTKTVNSISLPLHMLHMDLFGPTFVKILMKKMYCLVVIDDYRIENLLDHRVKVIRCDNGTELKNSVMNQFYEMKGIKREFSVARTPQQNGVAERKNRKLIEATRTMLVDSKLPTTFKQKTPTLSFMRPFGFLVTILNTKDHLGKFDGKSDEGLFVRYSMNSKDFRVFNNRTRIVEESLQIRFSENIFNVTRSGPNWLFDIDALIKTMNYKLVVAGTQTIGIAGTKANDNAGQASKETKPERKYIFLPLWTLDPPFSTTSKKDKDSENEVRFKDQEEEENVNNTYIIYTVNAADTNEASPFDVQDDPNMPELEEISRFSDAEDDNLGADMNNLDTYFPVNPITTIR
ncbi:putative ribonuclease H-like domain-containing protein [Tanacetum coccineum]